MKIDAIRRDEEKKSVSLKCQLTGHDRPELSERRCSLYLHRIATAGSSHDSRAWQNRQKARRTRLYGMLKKLQLLDAPENCPLSRASPLTDCS